MVITWIMTFFTRWSYTAFKKIKNKKWKNMVRGERWCFSNSIPWFLPSHLQLLVEKDEKEERILSKREEYVCNTCGNGDDGRKILFKKVWVACQLNLSQLLVLTELFNAHPSFSHSQIKIFSSWWWIFRISSLFNDWEWNLINAFYHTLLWFANE